MGAEKESPKLAQGAGCGRYVQNNNTFSCQSQAISPPSWFIRANFIESLVSKRFSAKNSLKVDFWLVMAEFLEGYSHVN